MPPLLRYFAGTNAASLLRTTGLLPGLLRGALGPATGPRWLGWAALDRALLSLMVPNRDGRAFILHGGSAGAFRWTALSAAEPRRTHEELTERYLTSCPRPQQTPGELSELYRTLLTDLFSHQAQALLGHPERELRIVTTRVTGPLRRTDHRATFGLLCSAVLSGLSPQGDPPWTERCVFSRNASDPGRRLTPENLVSVLLASGSVPGYMAPVRLDGTLGEAFLDGGLVEYHLGRDTAVDGVWLMIHHTPQLLSRWFDRFLPWARRPDLSNLLLLVPSRDYVAGLPHGVLPTRDDFMRHRNAPTRRISAWREATKRSELLARAFERDLESGALIDGLEAVPGPANRGCSSTGSPPCGKDGK